MSNMSEVPFREVHFAPRDIDVTRAADGTLFLSPRIALKINEPHLPAYLRRHAARRPDHTWLGQRRPKGGDWERLTFGDALAKANRLTQGLLDLAVPQGKMLGILSANSLEQALMNISAMQAHIPVVPISVAYSLQSKDSAKLKEVAGIVDIGVIFVQDGSVFAPAIAALGLAVPVIAVENVQPGQIAYADLLATEPSDAVEASVAGIDPQDVARIMFTSGSTGTPKGVPHTHHNIVVAAESNLQTNGHSTEGELARLDWTPWNHVFGATGVALALVNGGTLMIDDGRPVPGLFGETIRNLREFPTSSFVTVPSAYGLLIDALEADDELSKVFFSKIDMLGYGAASLPEEYVRRLQALAIKHIGMKISITCGYGATETGPGGAFIYWSTDRTGLIGLPHPGFEMKLVPLNDGRFEVRIRGEGVMRGYHGKPELNATIFDEDGFYKIGDTVRLADPADVMEGLVFAGRLSEEFKLTTGTFVLVGSLRLALLAAISSLVTDVVICGENRANISILAWLNVEAARKLVGDPDATREELNMHPAVISAVARGLASHNRNSPGISTRVERFMLLDEPPSIDDGEITDKGTINQRGVQKRREALVAALFADEAGGTVHSVVAAAEAA